MTTAIDWNKVWMERMRRSTWSRKENERKEYWDDKTAKEYYESMKGIPRVGEILAALALDDKSTFLDIGSGPGIFAIPAARACRRVTAVDPAPAVLSCLRRNADAENLTNISYVNKKWEDVIPNEDVGPHDVLFASYCLSMLDMRAALSKMDALARRSVHLIMPAGDAMESYRDLWLEIHGKPFVEGPGYIHVYNILHDMGIHANVEITEVEFPHFYTGLGEAVKLWKKMFCVDAEAGTEILRSRLPSILDERDGMLWWTRTEKSARIWWRKSPAAETG